MSARPPLPPGPFLVVGLARSGRAAGAGAARARGGRSPAATAGAVDAAARGELEAAGRRRCTSDRRRRAARRRRARWSRARACRRRRRWSARRASAGSRCSASSSSAGGCCPTRVDRDHRLERQDDDDRAGRPDPPRGRAARRGRGQRRDGADARSPGTLDPAAVVVCEASSFQLEDTRRVRARRRGAAQPRARPPRPPRHVRRLPRGQAADLRPPGAGRDRGAARRRSRPAARRGACAFASPMAAAPRRPTPTWSSRTAGWCGAASR